MRRHNSIHQLILAGLFFSFLLLAATSSSLFASTLVVDDCIKCHTLEPKQIAEDGAAHQSAISCIDCHTNHRPAINNNIPLCADCHAGTEHYALSASSCSNCHNPHQPLKITLSGELKSECITCHATQNTEMVANPSAHAEVSCNFCHAGTHGSTLDCLSCHQPHSATMAGTDCATCHAAHQPTLLAYPTTTANALCGSCHEVALTQLQASSTRHGEMSCASCHSDQHPSTASCADCHGTPHAAGIHSKFPRCMDCHNTAHDLNNLK